MANPTVFGSMSAAVIKTAMAIEMSANVVYTTASALNQVASAAEVTANTYKKTTELNQRKEILALEAEIASMELVDVVEDTEQPSVFDQVKA